VNRLGRVPALDGLRGVAVLLVVGRHYFHFPLAGGQAGLNLFFVLSGFLITTLLLEEHDDRGRISLGAFYTRRVRRLLPALMVMLAAYVAVGVAQGRTSVVIRAAGAAVFYTANIAQTWWPHLIGREPISPLWSLSEEEQFYLVWPGVLIALSALRVHPRRVGFGVAVLAIAVVFERSWLVMHGASPVRAGVAPDTASDGLLTGVLLAYVVRSGRRCNQNIGLVAATMFAFVALTDPPPEITIPALDMSSALLVWLATDPNSWLAKLASNRPLVLVGLVSYSVYLWHTLVLSWVGVRPAALMLTAVIAVASYRLIERPFRRDGLAVVRRVARWRAAGIAAFRRRSRPLPAAQ
jgi:peptidoglycan/LPS O-acetylase OafA/YrhL